MEMEIEIGVRNLMVEGRNDTVRSRSRDIWFVMPKPPTVHFHAPVVHVCLV
jgi:hypothetical protein